MYRPTQSPIVAALVLALVVPLRATAGSLELFEAGDFGPAAEAAREELAGNPASLIAMLVLGRSQLTLDQPKAAVETLRQAATRHPDSAEAHYRLGQALTLHVAESSTWRRMVLSDDIGAAFGRAVELEPANAEYRWALFQFCRHAPAFIGGGRTRAVAQAAELARIDRARGLRAEAALLEQDGKLALAESRLRAAVAAAPDVADHRFALGYFYVDHERWDPAFAVFEDIEREFPEERQALFQIGKAAALSGQRLAAGQSALKRYLQHKPRSGEPPHAWAHFRLGAIYERRKALEEAAAEYELAQALDPKLDGARAALAAVRRPAS